MDIVRSHRPCAFNEPPCVLGTGVPKHGSAGSASHVRDAYSFLKARLEKDGDPNCHGQEEKHSMSYIDNVRERLTSPYADVCKPWCVLSTHASLARSATARSLHLEPRCHCYKNPPLWHSAARP